jgi:hypothetical protein
MELREDVESGKAQGKSFTPKVRRGELGSYGMEFLVFQHMWKGWKVASRVNFGFNPDQSFNSQYTQQIHLSMTQTTQKWIICISF